MIQIDFRRIAILALAAFAHLPTLAATPMISVGRLHTCALEAGGAIQCWGDNYNGQLGNGNNVSSTAPVKVSGISSAISVSAGGGLTCAVLGSGGVKCWGSNGFGELNNGSKMDSNVPVIANGVSDATAVSVGWLHACALLKSGVVQCWGYNASGQLGDGNVSGAIGVSAGYNHSCAVLIGGTIKCWGSNAQGQLGNGLTANSLSAVSVSGITTAVSVSAGTNYSCAVLSSGAVQCWGSNRFGHLGNGTEINSLNPVGVIGINSAVAVATGSNSTCALLTGTVKCWGSNNSGQLGNGSTNNFSNVALPVNEVSTATVVSVAGHNLDDSNSYACTVLASGLVQCWGSSSGSSPITVPNLSLVEPDVTPNAFSLLAQSSVSPTSIALSNIFMVQGITSFAQISIVDGEYSINGGAFKSSSGTVALGDEVQVRLTAASNYSTTRNTILTIGGVSSMFAVTTKPTDTTPDAFSFTAQSGLLPGSIVTSNAITVQGINSPAAISIVGGEYSINGGNFVSGSTNVLAGSEIRVQVTSPLTFSSSASATLTIGGVAAVFKANNGPVFDGPKDCIFNWMEDHFAAFMSPSRAVSIVSGDVTYRYYAGSESFVGVSSQDSHIYFLSNLTGLLDLGLATTWSTKAGCQ